MGYDEEYFEWQRRIGRFGGTANAFKFRPYVGPADIVLDFGCGGGYLLAGLNCAQRIGVEINDAARREAERLGITVYKDIGDVPDESVTVIISNHALEHVECPLYTLRALLPKLKPGGKAVFVVPHQGPHEPYTPGDPNQHLYTWNPLTLGNLFAAAGYVEITVDLIRHRWPPGYERWYRLLGQRGFDVLCRLYAVLSGNYQLRAVAKRGSATD